MRKILIYKNMRKQKDFDMRHMRDAKNKKILIAAQNKIKPGYK